MLLRIWIRLDISKHEFTVILSRGSLKCRFPMTVNSLVQMQDMTCLHGCWMGAYDRPRSEF